MPFSESSEGARHILPERLFGVAARGETFQDEEFQHLTDCVFCQEGYKHFVRQRQKERGTVLPTDRSI